MTEKILYGLAEAAEMLGCSTKSLHRWIENGKLKAVRLGRVWKISAEELQRISKEGTG